MPFKKYKIFFTAPLLFSLPLISTSCIFDFNNLEYIDLTKYGSILIKEKDETWTRFYIRDVKSIEYYRVASFYNVYLENGITITKIPYANIQLIDVNDPDFKLSSPIVNNLQVGGTDSYASFTLKFPDAEVPTFNSSNLVAKLVYRHDYETKFGSFTPNNFLSPKLTNWSPNTGICDITVFYQSFYGGSNFTDSCVQALTKDFIIEFSLLYNSSLDPENPVIETNTVELKVLKFNDDSNAFLDSKSSDYTNFISDRTFSIFSITNPINESGYIGTTWILGKYCEWDEDTETYVFDEVNPYHYWMATNLHVRADIAASITAHHDIFLLKNNEDGHTQYLTNDEIGAETGYSFADDIDTNDWFATKKALNGGSQYLPAGGTGYVTTDFSVYELDLAPYMNTVGRSPENLNESLARVNEFCEKAGNDLHLAVDLGTTQGYTRGTDMYVAGYPSTSNGGIRYSAKHTTVAQTQDLYNTNSYIALGDTGYVYRDENDYYFDGGNLVYTNYFQGTRGGSSGSMVLDENKKLIGINFAGSSTESGTTILSVYLSLINNNYNLITGSDGFYDSYLKQST